MALNETYSKIILVSIEKRSGLIAVFAASAHRKKKKNISAVNNVHIFDVLFSRQSHEICQTVTERRLVYRHRWFLRKATQHIESNNVFFFSAVISTTIITRQVIVQKSQHFHADKVPD